MSRVLGVATLRFWMALLGVATTPRIDPGGEAVFTLKTIGFPTRELYAGACSASKSEAPESVDVAESESESLSDEVSDADAAGSSRRAFFTMCNTGSWKSLRVLCAAGRFARTNPTTTARR